MKKILFSLLFLPLLLYSQDYSYHRLKLGAGASGQSLLVWSLPELNNFISQASPVYQLSYDFIKVNDIGFGISATYQTFYFELYSNTGKASIEFKKPSLGLCASFLFIDKPKHSLYIQGRLGANFWSAYAKGTVNLETYNFDDWRWTYVRYILNPIIKELYEDKLTLSYNKNFYWTRLPLQVSFGYEYYFLPNAGVFVQLAVGSPYIAMSGLTIKLY